MEVKEKSKKRELIKSIAIVFLAVLLVLTLFSNTIMNASLPEVATQRITGGTINARIRGTGTVLATESYEVVIAQTRKVRSILVRVGDTVERGDVLFILEDGDSAELQAAEDRLRELNTQYQRQLLTLSQNYNNEDRSIRSLREELEALTKQLDENTVTDEALADARELVKDAEDELVWIKLSVTQYQLQLERAQSTLEDARAYLSSLSGGQGGGADVSAARRLLESYWIAYEAQYRELLQERVWPYYQNKMKNNQGTDGKPGPFDKVFGEKKDGDNTSYVFQYTVEESASAPDQGDGASPDTPPDTSPETPAGKTKIKIVDASIEDSSGVFTITSDQQKYIDAYFADPNTQGENSKTDQTVYQTLRDAYQNWQDTSKNSSAQGSVASAEYRVRVAEDEVTTCRNRLTNMQTAQSNQEAYIAEVQKDLSDLEAKRAAYETTLTSITVKERQLEDALADKNITHQLNDLDLAGLRRQIDRQQEEVDKLRSDVIDTEVKANVSGTITSINVSAGREAAAGMAMATIDLVDRGYTVRISVTSEQARQVKVGDIADVTNYYWGRSMEATLEQIIADPDAPGQRRLLVFRVTGDVDPGTNITLSIGQRSENYSAIVPKSALRQDTNGYFVLVVTSRSTPLGNRYTATRVDVQILAEDDTSAAVSGLAPNDYVITNSSAPLSAGSQVRLAEDPS